MMTNLRNSLQNVQSVSYYAYAAYEYVGSFWRAYFYFRYPPAECTRQRINSRIRFLKGRLAASSFRTEPL